MIEIACERLKVNQFQYLSSKCQVEAKGVLERNKKLFEKKKNIIWNQQ